MKPLLEDHVFSDSLRYEGHRLIYGTEDTDRIEIGGFLAAAVLGALLYGQEEGGERGIMLNTRDGRKEFFVRYEDETLDQRTILLSALPEEYESKKLYSEAQSQGICVRTATRWNEYWQEHGFVQKIRHGYYKKVE